MTTRAFALLLPVLVSTACGGDDSQGPRGRASDPPLTHTWTMPPTAGPVARVDLGTKPESNADEMMEGGKIAGLLYRIGLHCAELEELPSEGTVVLRFGISGDGILLDARGDPADGGGGCLARALEAEKDALSSLPAGAALARLHLQPAPSAVND